MKKRAMKKYIPKKTSYCKNCKWRKYIKTVKLHSKTRCEYSDECVDRNKCWTTPSTSCQTRVYRCEYLKYTDWNESSLLWDGVKECGISDISKDEYLFLQSK